MKYFRYLYLVCLVVFSVSFLSFSPIAKAAPEKSENLYIYQQLQERLKTAKKETQDLESYAQNAIDNLQRLELTLTALQTEQATLQANWTQCNSSLMASRNAYNAILADKMGLEVELARQKQKRKTALIVGIITGATIACAGGVTIGILAGRR